MAYLDWSDAVITVSHELARRAEAWHRPCVVVPNGALVSELVALQADRASIRRDLGFGSETVVSLVGLTAAPDQYWARAIEGLLAADQTVVFAAVGSDRFISPVMESMARRTRGARLKVVGPVNHEEAQRWFVASDVTWYPGQENDYFHVASPLKIFEGLAAGAHVVVAPKLRSLSELHVSSLHFAEPTPESLIRVTVEHMHRERVPPRELESALAAWTWDALAEKLRAFLERVSDEPVKRANL
jgi:hypothetical protein